MRVFLLCLLLVVGAVAQQPEITFQQVGGGSFAGFTDDDKAEKAWEATARTMRPTAEPGLWDMEQLKVQSYRAGRPQATFTSPAGTMNPTRRSAQGLGEIQAQAPSFQLAGKGWLWRSSSKGDSFAILADVVAELDLAKPASRRLRLRAPRMDATAVAGGTLMIFQGGVVAERLGERTVCERLECLVDDDPKAGQAVRQLKALGQVVRTVDKLTLRGDQGTFELQDDTVELIGQVEITDPELQGSAQRLRHAPKQGVTQLFSAEGVPVKLHLQGKKQDVADITGESVTLRRDPKGPRATIEVQNNATYRSPQGNLQANTLFATQGQEGLSEITGTGGVRGIMEGTFFEAGKARWQRTLRILDLAEAPKLRDARGLEAAGFTIRSEAAKERIEVRSAPGFRAAILLPAGAAGEPPGRAEANQIVVLNEDGVMQAELLGLVHYVAGPVVADAEQMVAFAVPSKKGAKDFVLQKAILTGKVHYGQPGLSCVAERIDLTPAVQIEEVLVKDALTGRPRLLTMSGGVGLTRPRLLATFASGKRAEFIADAHEILTTPAMTKFFLRGSVGMVAEETYATCDLLEGLATPDKAGRQVARQMVGRGNVQVVAQGVRAQGRTLEVLPDKNTARLLGEARILDRSGNEGIPAKEIIYDLVTHQWRMESALSEEYPGQVVRPKIFLGREFTLPEVKNLDKDR